MPVHDLVGRAVAVHLYEPDTKDGHPDVQDGSDEEEQIGSEG